MSPLWLPNDHKMTKQFSKLTARPPRAYPWAAVSTFIALKRKLWLGLTLFMNAILWLLRSECQ